tara:strand:- start:4845 stop:6482 length:1638 start_codon:yes stop_codon:yes gene_type:complete
MLLEPNESARIDYFFKNFTNTFLLPNQPNAVTVNQQTVHEHFYSIDGTPLSRRSNKVHWTISIEGFSGVAKRNFVDINGVKTLASIEKILQSFEEFLQKYREDGRSIDFFDLQKGKHYRDAFPVAFTYNSSVSGSRLGYTWQLELVCYSEVKLELKLNDFEQFFADLTSTIDGFTVVANDLDTFIEQQVDSFNRPVRELFNSVSRASRSVLNIAQSARGAVQSTRNTVLKAIDTIYEVGTTIVKIGDEVKSIFTDDFPSFYAENQINDGFTDVKNTLIELGLSEESLALQAEENVYQLELLIGLYNVYNLQSYRVSNSRVSGGSFLDKDNGYSTLASFQTTDNVVSTNDGQEQPKYKYILRAGENLYRVAVSVYNDVNRWTEIADLNDWLDANTTSSGYPPSAGDTIFLPSEPTQLGVSAIPNIVGNGSTLLTDIALVDGDLQLLGGDLKLVSGEDNFVQAVTNRIRTFQGGLIDDAEYGFPDIIGTTTPNAFISLQVVDQLLRDPRVLSVSDVKLEQEDDRAFLDLNVVPFEGDSVNIIVPVGD